MIDNGNSGSAATIDWTLGSSHRITLTANNCALKFVRPIGPSRLVLSIAQDYVGCRTVTWPPEARFPNGQPPVLSITPLKRDIFEFRFDPEVFGEVFLLDDSHISFE